MVDMDSSSSESMQGVGRYSVDYHGLRTSSDYGLHIVFAHPCTVAYLHVHDISSVIVEFVEVKEIRLLKRVRDWGGRASWIVCWDADPHIIACVLLLSGLYIVPPELSGRLFPRVYVREELP